MFTFVTESVTFNFINNNQNRVTKKGEKNKIMEENSKKTENKSNRESSRFIMTDIKQQHFKEDK
jgi:hypothetical protein